MNDRGWLNWSPDERTKFLADHRGVNPVTGNIATASSFVAGLNQPSGSMVNGGRNLDKILSDLGKAANGGAFDVLVFTDHGWPGGQDLGSRGDEYSLNPTNSEEGGLDDVVGFIKRGGTLVLTGRNTLGSLANPQLIANWQQYATDHEINIIGSVADVSWSPGQIEGVWVTLVPGGTAPKLTAGNSGGKPK